MLSSPETYVPAFVGPVEGWTVNFLTKHLWRVERSMDRDDALQEARLVFMKCERMYPGVEARHFMALYKTAWANRFNDLSDKASHLKAHEMHRNHRDTNNEAVEVEHHDLSVGETDNEGQLAVKIRQAPSEIRMVLNLFLSAPQEVLDVALASWHGRDRRCSAGGSKKVCQLLGLPEDLDVMQRVHDYFSSN